MDLSYLLPKDFDISQYPCFRKEGDVWRLTERVEDDLFVQYSFNGEKLIASVLDEEGEVYALFDLSLTPGSFVSSLREKVKDKLLEKLSPTSLISKRDEIIHFFFEQYSISPDKPWSDDDDTLVFRSKKNSKWIALLMEIPLSKLDKRREGISLVMNIKHDSASIPSLIDNTNIFPAWHMGKKNWISVLVDDSLSFEKLWSLVERSRFLVEGE